LRFTTAFYIVGLSLANIIVSRLTGNIGGIIASVYIIQAAFVLFALEFGFLCRRIGSRIPVLHYEMHPTRTIALQALGAVITGGPLFIPGRVALGLAVGLMNLVGIYHLFWSGGGAETGSDTWSQDEKAPRGPLIMPPTAGEEDALLISMLGSEDDVESQAGSDRSNRGGPTVLGLD
jgi:hypothetical protein